MTEVTEYGYLGPDLDERGNVLRYPVVTAKAKDFVCEPISTHCPDLIFHNGPLPRIERLTLILASGTNITIEVSETDSIDDIRRKIYATLKASAGASYEPRVMRPSNSAKWLQYAYRVGMPADEFRELSDACRAAESRAAQTWTIARTMTDQSSNFRALYRTSDGKTYAFTGDESATGRTGVVVTSSIFINMSDADFDEMVRALVDDGRMVECG